MRLRPTTSDEADALAEVHRAAFAGDVEAELARELMRDDSFVPAISFAAERRGALVGHVLFTRAWLNRDDGYPGFPLLLLAPLAVVPEAQGEGIGTFLVEAAIALARESGEIAMLVLGDPAYYARFGFVSASPLGIHPPFPIEPPEAWQALVLVPEAPEDLHGTVQVAGPLDAPELWRE